MGWSGARLTDHRSALVVKIEGEQGGGGVYEGVKVKGEIQAGEIDGGAYW